MAGNLSALAGVKPRLAAMVDELVAKGADRLSIVYVMEKKVAVLRDGLSVEIKPNAVEEPSSHWPAA